MKTKISLLSVVAMLFVASSCGNADMEKRIATLERRVNQIETQGVNRPAQQPTATSTSQPVEQNLNAKASFAWDQTLYNFGTIKQGEIVNYTFKFTNNGTEPLTISNASASCGCTVPQWPREAIAPGATGEIVVRFDSKGKSGQQSPVITVVANTNPQQARLSLRGLVQTS
jgi:outer membrane biosynthesis protein TonB